MPSRRLRALALALLPLVIAACGGGDGGTSPSAFASISVSPAAPTISVGSAVSLTAVAKTASGTTVAGVTFIWSSSDATRATVTASGVVSAIAPGPATITAFAQGKAGQAGVTVIDIPVVAVDVTPATPSIGVSGVVVMTATPRDLNGHPLTRTVTWAVSDGTKLSLSSTTGSHVSVTGLATGTGLTVTATAGGTSGSTTMSVVAGTSPTVSAVAPNPLLPGGSATITGTNFDPTPANDVVTVDGIAATVTAASATQLTITLPTGGFACSATRDVAVTVITNALSGARLAPLDPASTLSLTAGQSQFFDATAASGSCVKLPMQAGSSYLVSVANGNALSTGSATFALGGATAALVFPVRVAPDAGDLFAGVVARAAFPLDGPNGVDGRTSAAAHRALLERDRRIVKARGGPRGARAALARRSRLVSAVFNPHLNDTLTVKIDDIDHDPNCTIGFDRRARVAYVSSTTVVFDDLANPLFGQLNAEMQAMGAEFDALTLPVETTYFGNPLAYDAALGQKGHVLIFFTSKVNSFAGGGIAGFVNSCDFFAYDVTPGPLQDTVSNEAPIFYAFVPTTAGNVPSWQSFVRSVLPHESKHLASYAEKFQRGAISFEDTWLEEATAQTASEIWGRNFSSAAWKGHATFATTLGCEYPTNPCGGDHPTVMRHHFGYLYDYLSNFTLETPTSDAAEVYYGGAWSFVRWAVDQYAGDEATMLQGITQTTTIFGVDNLVARAGAPYAEMSSRWALASALAAYSVTPADPKLRFPSWDQGGIYRGLNSNEPTIWVDPYPLLLPNISFGAFQVGATVPGGGARIYHLSGTQAQDQLISVQAAVGTPLPPTSPLRLAIVRVQ